MTLIEKADQFAAHAHEGQTRKGSDTPYITHPRAVAALLKALGFNDTVVAAALLHDTVEDTSITLDDVRREFGEEVAGIVGVLSEDKSLPWEKRKELYVAAVRGASAEVKAISAADKIHNAQSLLAAYDTKGPAVWAVFNRSREKKFWFEGAMLDMLQETWQHPLVDEYAVLVERLKALD